MYVQQFEAVGPRIPNRSQRDPSPLKGTEKLEKIICVGKGFGRIHDFRMETKIVERTHERGAHGGNVVDVQYAAYFQAISP